MRQPQPYFREQRQCWYVQLGKRQIKLDRDEKKAREKYHALMLGRQHVTETVRVNAVLLAFLEWAKKHRKPSSHEFYKRYVVSFAKQLPAGLAVGSLKPYHVTNWVDACYGEGGSNYRRNAIRAVQRALNWAVNEGYIEASPIAKVRKPASRPRDTIVTGEQWDRLSEVLRSRGRSGQSLLDLLTLMRQTGCRPLEARTVEARHLDRKARCLVFERELSKGQSEDSTVERRVVPLADEAFALCDRLAGERPRGPMFCKWTGKPWTNRDLKDYFGRLTRPMPRKDRKTGKPYQSTPALNFPVTAYVIRHTWATEAIERGLDLVTIATIMGHKDLSMLMKVYQHIKKKQEHLRSAVHQAIGAALPVAMPPVAVPA